MCRHAAKVCKQVICLWSLRSCLWNPPAPAAQPRARRLLLRPSQSYACRGRCWRVRAAPQGLPRIRQHVSWAVHGSFPGSLSLPRPLL